MPLEVIGVSNATHGLLGRQMPPRGIGASNATLGLQGSQRPHGSQKAGVKVHEESKIGASNIRGRDDWVQSWFQSRFLNRFQSVFQSGFQSGFHTGFQSGFQIEKLFQVSNATRRLLRFFPVRIYYTGKTLFLPVLALYGISVQVYTNPIKRYLK